MNDSIITPINIISLDSADYGVDLNNRLEIINNNFTKIIQSDFLQGIPGNTIGIICVNFDETIPNDESNFATVDNDTSIIQVPNHLIDNGTTSDLYYYYPTQDDENYIGVTIDNLKDKLKEAIINDSNDTTPTRYDLINLDGYSITLYYEYNVTIGKYFLVSSLPFIYYDKYALDELANNTDNTEVEDLSCALVYSKNEDEYGFRSIHPFPQIYYDRNQSNGNLCWKINGIETGISCQGIQGTNGRNGSTYMAYVDTEQSNKNGLYVSKIYGILKLTPNAENSTIYSPEVIEPADFKNNGIFIEQGDVLICVPATINSENNYVPSNGVYISIAHIIQNGNTTEYYVLSDDEYISYITPLDTNAVGLLYNGLSCIGFNGSDNVKPLRGLFIPTGLTNTSSENGEGTENTTENTTEDTTEDTISGHMLWASKGEINDNINILNISHVKNVDAPIVDEDIDTELKIDYNVIRLGLTENSTVHVNDLRVNSGKLINGLIEIKYNDLKTQRDDGELCPGQLYRITDYITTTSQTDTTQSANHQFDIIVLALSENKLSERAWAIQHTGDSYFANSKLEAWQLWYCLDNDKDRFIWADDTDAGKGVIYRMIDEFGNDCPYDFKNIMLYCLDFDDDLEFYYTFTGNSSYSFEGDPLIPANREDDWSLIGKVKNNKVYYDNRNGISKILFQSLVLFGINQQNPYRYCCNNNIINSDEIIITGGGRNNTVMSSSDIKLSSANNCNIPAGSVNISIDRSSVTYLGDIETYDDCGLLNDIRVAGNQIMIIPMLEVIKNVNDELELKFFDQYKGLNFSIEDHVKKMGFEDSPQFYIQIPKNVSTVIMHGSINDDDNNKFIYIELPTDVPIGHTIEFFESSVHSSNDVDFEIMVNPMYHPEANLSNPHSFYHGRYIYSNGSTNDMTFIAEDNKPVVQYINNKYETFTKGALLGKYVLLPVRTRKRFTYVGSNPYDGAEFGTWIG